MSLEWGDRVKTIREMLNVSQKVFGNWIGASQAEVAAWEKDEIEPKLCWERIIQYIEDCSFEALEMLDRVILGDEGWPTRIETVMKKLGWDDRRLSEFLGTNEITPYRWKQGDTVGPCYRMLIALLELYSDIEPDRWPPALYSEPPDVITPERIKLLRLSLGMTQVSFSRVIHVTNALISSLERGDNGPSWCTNLLLKIMETYPRAVDLFSKIPPEEFIPPERPRRVREKMERTRLEMAHLLGATEAGIRTLEVDGAKLGCSILVYRLLEQYPEEFISYIEGLSSPGGQACPIW